jgi:histidinol-phosphatase (PHP family)
MYDYHTHSSFSSDSDEPLEAMVQRAVALGITEYAVTDHYDPEYRNEAYNIELDSETYFSEMERLAEKYRSEIKVIKGIELGIQHDVTDHCLTMLSSYPFDFVLGSFHCTEGFEICDPEYCELRKPEELYRGFYGYMLRCLDIYKDYDVLGHFNVIDRYASAIPSDETYLDLVEAVVRRLVDDGKGIEINTSSFRYGMGERTTPTADILKLYVKMGGEIVTMGSDAHRVRDVGAMLDRAVRMMGDAGIKYLATFENREVKFVKIQ